jgi:small subunit ribosomal protein S1
MAFKIYDPKAHVAFSADEDEFAAFMDAKKNEPAAPRYGRGDEVTGRVIRVSGDVAFIDLGGKAEGILELSMEEAEALQPNSQVTGVVISTDGAVRMRRNLLAKSGDNEAIGQAFQLGIPVEGKITGRNKGGFDVQAAGSRAFLPLGQLALEQIPELELDSWIGTSHQFKIIEYDPGARRLVVSRAGLLRDAREAKAREAWLTLEVGQVRVGTVRSVQDYGCFVDIGGVDGLVHVGEMDWARVSKPADLVTPGQEVTVVILGLDPEKKRVSLSMKAAGNDPWKALPFRVGDLVEAKVGRIERFGAFVELTHGVEGLVHISEMTHERRIRHPSDVLNAGDAVRVTILDIDLENRRVALSMKQAEADPWATVEQDYKPGTRVTGTVERVAAFGVFVKIAPAITALLPGSETGLSAAEVQRRFRIGAPVEASVLAVDPANRRMSLSIKSEGEREERENTAAYRQRSGEKASLGTFADLFAAKTFKK